MKMAENGTSAYEDYPITREQFIEELYKFEFVLYVIQIMSDTDSLSFYFVPSDVFVYCSKLICYAISC